MDASARMDVAVSQSASPINSEAKQQFARDGFLIIPRLVSDTEVDRLRASLLQLHERDVGFASGASFDASAPSCESSPNARRFPQIIDPRIFDPTLTAGEFYTTALALARTLLGPDARLKNDISFMKPALIGDETAWHQDEAFANPDYDHQEVTVWLALTEANRSNSCMSYLPGSNRWAVLPHRPLGGDPRVHALECIGSFDATQAVECPLHPGGAVAHAHRTLHYSGPNTSDQTRIAYALLFDVPPQLRKSPQDFPWRRHYGTARMQQQRRFLRRGGVFIWAWRKRKSLPRRVWKTVRRIVMR